MKNSISQYSLLKGNDFPYKTFFVSVVIFSSVFLVIQSFTSLSSMLFSAYLTPVQKISLSYFLIWDSLVALSIFGKIILATTILVGSVNTSLIYLYFKQRLGYERGGSVFSSLGTLVAFLGLGCGACGGIILSYLSFFPAAYLPFLVENNIILLVGIAIMISSTVLLINKLIQKNTC